MTSTTRYVACSCNRVPHCADWGANGLICFGTCNAIAIYEPCAFIGRVTHTLHRHRDRVNTVHWIKQAKNGAPEAELLSGSVDGTAIIWRLEKGEGFRVTSVLDVGSVVTFVDSLQLSDDVLPSSSLSHPRLLICTGSINGELKLWSREANLDVRIVQTISYGRRLPIHCRLTYLPNAKSPLLAVALEDASIQLYAKDSRDVPDSNFVRIQSLVGHQDWVRCIDFHRDCDESIFLATGSQDNTIRLWKIAGTVAGKSSSDKLEQKRDTFTINDREYSITLESVLSGHEGWVYGVHWQPTKGNQDQTTRLLSSSLDKSMIIWELDHASGIWIERVRVGEVGGNSLGFYGCKFSPDGSHILAHGYQGSFHIWKYSQEIANWIPRSIPSGHFSEVIDLCWEPKGRFLITASTDQTTKIYAPWKDDLEELWHEIARPQVHGYDMSCLVMLTPYMYASGAEEKVVRIFAATSAFKNRLGLLADNVEDFKSTVAYGATVPSLGLTNKATFNEKVNAQRENERDPTRDVAYEPSTEEELAQNTLWPELQKLYGHGYEIFCMTARHDGQLLATACKSTNLEHSAIILWSTDIWSQVQKLISHQLTVTQMEFSPNDRYLLSVSRDRKWSLFKNEDEIYALIAVSSKKDSPHSRIIWCCAWTSDSNYFATGSRDGKIGIWFVETMEDSPKDVIPKMILDKKNQSVTAVCFAPSCMEGSYVLAIGYETGCIEIQKITINYMENIWSRLLEYDTSQAHHLTVKRLMFRPNNEQLYKTLQLASCSSDHSVKIYDINLSLLDLKT